MLNPHPRSQLSNCRAYRRAHRRHTCRHGDDGRARIRARAASRTNAGALHFPGHRDRVTAGHERSSRAEVIVRPRPQLRASGMPRGGVARQLSESSHDSVATDTAVTTAIATAIHDSRAAMKTTENRAQPSFGPKPDSLRSIRGGPPGFISIDLVSARILRARLGQGSGKARSGEASAVRKRRLRGSQLIRTLARSIRVVIGLIGSLDSAQQGEGVVAQRCAYVDHPIHTKTPMRSNAITRMSCRTVLEGKNACHSFR